MTPIELRKIQTDVASVASLLLSLDLEGCLALMERVASEAKIAEPITWAKAKDAHIRMSALVGAALTFKNTVRNIQGEIPTERPSRSSIILP